MFLQNRKMNKTILALFVALAMLTSCEKGVTMDSTGDNSPATSENTVPVTLSFFDVSMEDLTTPGSRADEDEGEAATDENASDLKKAKYFTRLSIAIFPLSKYTGEERHIEQDSIQEDFGRLSIELPLGKYKMVAVAYKADAPATIESQNLVTFPNEKVSDMVFVTQELDITGPECSFSCPMKRAVTAFTLQSTDISPEYAKQARATFKSHCSYQFDPATTFNPGPKEYSSIVDLGADKAGETRRMTFYTILDQEVQDDVEILIEILGDNCEVLNKFNFENVKLVQNKRTTYSGKLFTSGAGIDFTMDITPAVFEDSGGDMNF